jgi:hypothetical protein
MKHIEEEEKLIENEKKIKQSNIIKTPFTKTDSYKEKYFERKLKSKNSDKKYTNKGLSENQKLKKKKKK